MSSPNRTLAIVFAVVAVMQTALPIVVQRATHAIVYHEALHCAVAGCLAAAIAVGLCQAISRRFSAVGLLLFYLGLAALITFDIAIERAIEASC